MEELEKYLLNDYSHCESIQLSFNPHQIRLSEQMSITDYIEKQKVLISDKEKNEVINNNQFFTVNIIKNNRSLIHLGASSLTQLIKDFYPGASKVMLNNIDDLMELLIPQLNLKEGQFNIQGTNINYSSKSSSKFNWTFLSMNKFNRLCPEIIENENLNQLLLSICPKWKISLEKNHLDKTISLNHHSKHKLKL
jgi:hypothetical protein